MIYTNWGLSDKLTGNVRTGVPFTASDAEPSGLRSGDPSLVSLSLILKRNRINQEARTVTSLSATIIS